MCGKEKWCWRDEENTCEIPLNRIDWNLWTEDYWSTDISFLSRGLIMVANGRFRAKETCLPISDELCEDTTRIGYSSCKHLRQGESFINWAGFGRFELIPIGYCRSESPCSSASYSYNVGSQNRKDPRLPRNPTFTMPSRWESVCPQDCSFVRCESLRPQAGIMCRVWIYRYPQRFSRGWKSNGKSAQLRMLLLRKIADTLGCCKCYCSPFRHPRSLDKNKWRTSIITRRRWKSYYTTYIR